MAGSGRQGGDGGTLTAPEGISFDLARVFDLIPRTRLRAATTSGPVLTLTTAPGISVAAGRQGDLFVLDLSGTPTPPPGAITAVPPLADDPRDLGAIKTLPGVGEPPRPASAQAQSIEQALLFRIAQAAGEGNLTVADRATLDALRRAGLVPPGATEPEAVGASASEAAQVSAAPAGTDAITCDQALTALTFPADAPTSIQGYEQAYLAMDRANNDPGLVDLARGYLALALPDEALAILSLRADPGRADARVLIAAAETLDGRPASPAAVDLIALSACGPGVELWALARTPVTAPRAAPYALFQALLAIPPAARTALINLLRRNLAGLKDSAATALLRLIDGISPDCASADCSDAPAIGDAVMALSQLDRATLADQAREVYLRLLDTTTLVSVETAHHLDAMAFERRADAGGALMRASALVAYARAGDFDATMAKLAALNDNDRHDPALTQAATAALRIFAQDASDADFLRLAFAHMDTINQCCAGIRPAIDARLASHGFGTGNGKERAPTSAPGDASTAAVATTIAATAKPPPAAPMAAPDAPTRAPSDESAAVTGASAPSNAASATPATAMDKTSGEDSDFVARSREKTQSSAALRADIAARLAKVGITTP